jgi:hypothetical protein
MLCYFCLWSCDESPKEYISAFVDANCEKFEFTSDEFTHEQYAAWKVLMQ